MSITAEKAGFAVALVDGVQVQVGARQRIDLQMAIGQVTEKVEVTATAPLVETETSQRGQVISDDRDPRTAAERTRVFLARAPDDRRPAVIAEQEHQRHTARGGVQRQRPPERVQQLPHRRPRQQRVRHEQPGLLQPGDAAVAGCGQGIPRGHQQPERGIRPRGGRDDQRGCSAAGPTSSTAPDGSSSATRS